MTKPRLVKVRALFYVFQYITKQRGCANFDTASYTLYYMPLALIAICKILHELRTFIQTRIRDIGITQFSPEL